MLPDYRGRQMERIAGPSDADVRRHPANSRSETSRASMTPGPIQTPATEGPGVMQIPAPGAYKIGVFPVSNPKWVTIQVEYERGIFTDWLPVEMAKGLVKALETEIVKAETGLQIVSSFPGV